MSDTMHNIGLFAFIAVLIWLYVAAPAKDGD